jgi:hypothetical protein
VERSDSKPYLGKDTVDADLLNQNKLGLRTDDVASLHNLDFFIADWTEHSCITFLLCGESVSLL